MTEPVKFEAEITEIKVKKLISNDKEYKVVLLTDDPAVLRLAAYVNEQPVKVEVKESV